MLLFTDSDYTAFNKEKSQFPKGITTDKILISTHNDSMLEINEQFVVYALLPEDRGVCSTTVTIVDNSKLIIYKY